MKPEHVNILGIEYAIQYCDKPSDVDINHYASLWGQIDHWTRSIRIYDLGRSEADQMQTLLHEVLHGIGSLLHIPELQTDKNELVDLIALGLLDVFTRNGWLNNAAENGQLREKLAAVIGERDAYLQRLVELGGELPDFGEEKE